MKRTIFLLLLAFLCTACVAKPDRSEERKEKQKGQTIDSSDGTTTENTTVEEVEKVGDEAKEKEDNAKGDERDREVLDLSERALKASFEANLKRLGSEKDREAWKVLESIVQTGYFQKELMDYYTSHQQEISTFGKITMAKIVYFNEVFFHAHEISSGDAFDLVLMPMLLDSSGKLYALEDVDYLEQSLRDVFRSSDEAMSLLEREGHPKAVAKELLKDRQILNRLYAGNFVNTKDQDALAIVFDPEDQTRHEMVLISGKEKTILDEKEFSLSNHTLLVEDFLGKGTKQALFCIPSLEGNQLEYILCTFDGGKITEREWKEDETIPFDITTMENFGMRVSFDEEEINFSLAKEERLSKLFFHEDGTPRDWNFYEETSFYAFYGEDEKTYIHVAKDLFMIGEDPEVSNLNYGPERMVRLNAIYRLTEEGMEPIGTNIYLWDMDK